MALFIEGNFSWKPNLVDNSFILSIKSLTLLIRLLKLALCKLVSNKMKILKISFINFHFYDKFLLYTELNEPGLG